VWFNIQLREGIHYFVGETPFVIASSLTAEEGKALVNRKLFPEKSAKELLVQFRETGSEEPYEEIVRRYAAMVYGVCLRITGDKHDAEDATQAVFLSLALQAKTSREITYVGPWLQKVAHRLALDVKKAKTRRKKREDKLADAARHNGNGHSGHNGNGNGNGNGFFGGRSFPNPADHPGTDELKSIMMEELNKLPAKYRMPLVLHYFGGLSREEMAEELSCNPSTLGVRVHRGKNMLGKRLAKRGMAISAIALAVVLEHVIRTTTVHPLMASASAATVGAAGGSTAGYLIAGSNLAQTNAIHAAAIAQATARVFAITRTALRSVVYAKAKFILTIALLIITAVVTAGSVVAKITDMHVSPLIDVHQWLRPLLDSFTPSLQADATPPSIDVDRDADVPAAPSTPPLDIKVNLDQLGLGTPVPSAARDDLPAKTQAGGGSSALASASSVNGIPAPAPSSSSILSLTREPVGTPVRLPSAVAPTLALGIGNDPAKKSTDSKTGEDPTKTLIASESGEFSLVGAGAGGGFGKADVYVMPANATLHNNSMVIADTGMALFEQNGGTNNVNGTLTIGRKKGSVGTYQQNAGALNTINEVIGGEGDGTFMELHGINVARDSIIVGNFGRGSYTASGDSNVFVINAQPSSDPTEDLNGLHLGEQAGSTGTFAISGAATLNADPQIIGAAGTGTLTQTGGTNITGAIALATQLGSNGTYDLASGDLIVKPPVTKKPTPTISIGVQGKGTFKIGSGDSTGTITEASGTSGSVVVRGQARGDGSLMGYGKIALTGIFVENGQVGADGHGKNRTLDLSSFSSVTSNIDNSRWNGTNGWFARRKGRLLLPAIPVHAGNGTYTWGEDASDPLIDLVNSVRFDIEGAKQDGDVSIALVSPLRDDIPKLPWGHHFIGVWSFDGSELGGFDGMDLQVRYDDTMAKELKLDEDILKLWRYDTSLEQWIRINDASFTRDTLDHILTGHAPGDDISYFAVSAPEPAGVTLLLLGASTAILRRRRRKSE
jgi:RNA polymerase sigma factor (sigma-70 family)